MGENDSELLLSKRDMLQVPNHFQRDISMQVRRKLHQLGVGGGEKKSGICSLIPRGGVILDVGCGNGELGAEIARLTNCKLAQADFLDQRGARYKYEFLKMKRDKINLLPEWQGFADVVLLVDVLQHVGPKLDYLKSLLSALFDKNSKIVIAFTNNSGNYLQSDADFWQTVKNDPELSGKIFML